MRILIVDDSKAVHAFVKAALANRGHEFDDAFDGEEALRMTASGKRYELILLDWEMPLLTGVETVSRLRAGGVRSKVVMVTSKNDPQDIGAALAGGADEYVMKPFTKEILLDKLAMIGLPGVAA